MAFDEFARIAVHIVEGAGVAIFVVGVGIEVLVAGDVIRTVAIERSRSSSPSRGSPNSPASWWSVPS